MLMIIYQSEKSPPVLFRLLLALDLITLSLSKEGMPSFNLRYVLTMLLLLHLLLQTTISHIPYISHTPPFTRQLPPPSAAMNFTLIKSPPRMNTRTENHSWSFDTNQFRNQSKHTCPVRNHLLLPSVPHAAETTSYTFYDTSMIASLIPSRPNIADMYPVHSKRWRTMHPYRAFRILLDCRIWARV